MYVRKKQGYKFTLSKYSFSFTDAFSQLTPKQIALRTTLGRTYFDYFLHHISLPKTEKETYQTMV